MTQPHDPSPTGEALPTRPADDEVASAVRGLPDASIAVVLGTRPEVVKLAGIIRLLGPAARILHTGQHFSPQLAEVFFTDFGLPAPAVQLAIGGTSRGAQIGEATRLLDEHFAADPPRAVVVQGDTNTVAAGALAANARGIPLVHIEAGLRSHDRAMPEEHNRVITDHLADLLCAPTATTRDNLAAEGITAGVVVTGNTVVEAVHELLATPDERAAIRDRFVGLDAGGYVLTTFHRPENVDDRDNLAKILTALAGLDLPAVLPLHPRTEQRIANFGLSGLLEEIVITPPASYREFLALAADCALLISDSGGVQEESSVLKRPIVVVRRSTERPEVIGTFATLVPPEQIDGVAGNLLARIDDLHDELAAVPSPYGDGTASLRSVAAIVDLVTRDPAAPPAPSPSPVGVNGTVDAPAGTGR